MLERSGDAGQSEKSASSQQLENTQLCIHVHINPPGSLGPRLSLKGRTHLAYVWMEKLTLFMRMIKP